MNYYKVVTKEYEQCYLCWITDGYLRVLND